MNSDNRGVTGVSSSPVAYGLDFSWGRPSAESILNAGYTFVLRYLSWSTTGKNLTADEARYYQAYGIGIGSNWEYYADAPKNGYPQGVSDATEGARQHTACGGGEWDPIYFSVDYDAQVGTKSTMQLFTKRGWGRLLPWWLILLLDGGWRTRHSSLWSTGPDWPAVSEYFRGVSEVVGLDRTGAYGSYQVIRQLFNEGKILFGWQTYAWSYGAWDPRAQLRQVQNGITVGGADVDRNESWSDNAGLWGQNQPPRRHSIGDGAVLLNCPFDETRQDLFYVGPNNEVWHSWWAGGMPAMWAGSGASENLGGRIVQGTLTAQWTPDGSAVMVAGLGSATEGAPVGAGSWWGSTLDRYGTRSGWGSLEGVYGQYPEAPPVARATKRDDRAWYLVGIVAVLVLAGILAWVMAH